MTTRVLFQQLCGLADALQAEGARLTFSPHKMALEQVVERLDALIDQVVEEGIHEEAEETHG